MSVFPLRLARDALRWMPAVLAIAGCGPPQRVLNEGAGSTTVDVPDPAPTDSSSSGEPEASDTGEPTTHEVVGCWTQIHAGASGIEDLWTDGESVVASALDSIIVFDGGRWREIPTESFVTRAAGNAFDDVWLIGEGVTHWDGAKFEPLALPDSFSPEVVASDGSGLAWLGGGSWVAGNPLTALFELFDGEYVQIDAPPEVAGLSAVDGTLWTVDSGAFARRRPSGTWEVLAGEPTALRAPVLPVSDTTAWGAAGGEIVRYAAGEWWTEPLASEGVVRDLVQDASGAVWALVSYLGSECVCEVGAAERLGPFGFSPVATGRGLTSMAALADGSIWVGSRAAGNRIARIDPSRGELETVWSRDPYASTNALTGASVDSYMGVDDRALQLLRAGDWSRAQVPDGVAGPWFTGLWSPEVGQGWAVAESGTPLWRIEDDALVAWPLELADVVLFDVWGNAPDRVYAVGAIGAGFPREPLVLRFDGQRWEPDYPLVLGQELAGVSGFGESVFVYSSLGVAWFDGQRWSDLPSLGGDARPVALHAVGTHELWVVEERGAQRQLRHWIGTSTGGDWSVQAQSLAQLAHVGGGADDLWIASYDPPGLAHFDGSTWVPVAAPPGMGRMSGILAAADGLVVDDGRSFWTFGACDD